MAINYPASLDTLTNPSGTSLVTSPDHAQQHSDVNDAIEAIESVLGTTSGTSVLKHFSAGQFPARVNSGGTIVQVLTGGTINNTTLGTPAATGGTFSSITINNSTLGTPNAASGTYSTPTFTGQVTVSGTVAHRVKVFRSAEQSIPNNAETPIQWNNEAYDTNSMHDNASNNTRITFTSAGIYRFGGNIVWSGNGTGRRYAYVKLNGGTALVLDETGALGAPSVTTHVLSAEGSFTANDYIELVVFQTSGGTIGTYVDVTNPNIFWASQVV